MLKKIIALFLAVMFIFSLVMSVAVWRSGAGVSVWNVFVAGYFFALFFVTCNLHNLKSVLKKMYKPIVIVFYSGMVLFFVLFTVFCIAILGYEADALPESPDIVIILGCQVHGDRPSVTLKTRLDLAVEVLGEYPDAVCITVGGQGAKAREIMPESAVMKKYLADNGIDKNIIFEESKSTSTFENLLFAKKVIEENNLKHENIIIVTNEFHTPRAIMIAKRLYSDSGAQFYAAKAKSPFPMAFPMFNAGIVREFFAFVKSFIFDR